MRRDRAWAGVVVMACALTACAEAPRDEAPVTPEREAVDVGWSGAVERPEPTLEAAPEESAESAEAATASDTAAADPVGGPRQQGRGGLLGALGGAGRGLREAEAAPAPAAPAPRRS
ncbi:MAG TPA: hypothetical protein RMH99_27325, partial [Sandaracinaceae bacterium LLY-WYZ-13_1]|nr:hypothetical protein [Sandaracinaceae bacterium LLY-WYZ-13_1]